MMWSQQKVGTKCPATHLPMFWSTYNMAKCSWHVQKELYWNMDVKVHLEFITYSHNLLSLFSAAVARNKLQILGSDSIPPIYALLISWNWLQNQYKWHQLRPMLSTLFNTQYQSLQYQKHQHHTLPPSPLLTITIGPNPAVASTAGAKQTTAPWTTPPFRSETRPNSTYWSRRGPWWFLGVTTGKS